MLNKIKHIINAVRIYANECKEKLLYQRWDRKRQKSQHQEMIKEAEIMQRRPAITIANAPRIEIKKAA